jgi:ATP-dependent Clp protease ATP-binding subunit ClpA
VWGVEVPYLLIEGPNYTDASDINELRGSTRGFIRSDEEGILAEFHERAARAPFSVILVDEVEKAHPHLRKFFLSMMDRGTVTDNRGRQLAFPGVMLVFTSNAGYTESAERGGPIGYGGQDARESYEKAEAEAGLRKTLSPEFMNRVKIVRFAHLEPVAFDRIFDLELGRIAARYRQMHGLELSVTAAAREAMIRRGTSWQFGARHLASVVDRICNIEVARMILRDMTRRSVTGGAGPGAGDLLVWLREIRAGERAYDADEVRGRVLDETRARLPYSRIEVGLEPAPEEDSGATGAGRGPEPATDRFVWKGLP